MSNQCINRQKKYPKRFNIKEKLNIEELYMSLTQDFNSLFAPMDKKYCDLFYGISVFYFLLMISSLMSLIFLLRDVKKNKFLIVNSVVIVVMLGINYIYNRLLFNMCK